MFTVLALVLNGVVAQMMGGTAAQVAANNPHAITDLMSRVGASRDEFARYAMTLKELLVNIEAGIADLQTLTAEVKMQQDELVRRKRELDTEVKMQQDELERREKELFDRAEEVQLHHAQQQAEKRRKSSNHAKYSIAHHLHLGSFAPLKSWEAAFERVRQLTAMDREHYVEALNGTHYPLVLLFVSAADSRLSEVVKAQQVEHCRGMVAPGGKLVLVVMFMEEHPDAVKRMPHGIDEIISFPVQMGLNNVPHKLVENARMSDNSREDLLRLIELHVPRPPVVGPDCLFKWFFGQWCHRKKDEL